MPRVARPVSVRSLAAAAAEAPEPRLSSPGAEHWTLALEPYPGTRLEPGDDVIVRTDQDAIRIHPQTGKTEAALPGDGEDNGCGN